jgi:lipopolysaccharide export system protein LptA
MKEKFVAFVIILLLIGAVAGYPTLARAKTSLPSLLSSESSDLVINAPSEIDLENKVVVYSFPVQSKKIVHVTYGESEMTCRQIEITYNDTAEKDTKQKGQPNTDKINKIVIKGDVRITRPDGISVVADNIVYTKADEKVVLTGSPAIINGDGYKMENARIIYDLNNGKISGEDADTGMSRTTIYPNKLKGQSSAPQKR